MPLKIYSFKIFNIILFSLNFTPLAILIFNTSHFANKKFIFLLNTLNSWETQKYGKLLINRCVASNSKSPYQKKIGPITYSPINILNDDTQQLFNKYKNSSSFIQIKKLDQISKKLKNIDIEYKNKFSRCEIEKEILLITNSLIDSSGIIVPPYMQNLRDLIENHTLFFVEKHDGNLSIGSPRIANEFDNRMYLLTGLKYRQLSAQTSGLMYSQIRQRFLRRNESEIRLINKKYPSYKYLLTEKEHELNFTVLNKSENFILYKID